MSESDTTTEVLAGEVVDAARPDAGLHGRSAHEADASGLAPLPSRVGAWACVQLNLEGDSALVIRFQHVGSDDWVEVTAVPSSANGAVFHRMELAAVRYRGKVTAPSDERRAEVRALVLGVCAAMNARMALAPGRTLAEAVGRSREGGRMVFSRDTLRALLAPDIVEGRAGIDGWTLVDVYPTSYQTPGSGALLELVLEFRRDEISRLLFVVSPRPVGKPGFAQSAHFNIGFLTLGGSEPRGTGTLRALLSFVFQLRDHDGLDVVFPTVDQDISTLLLPAPTDAPVDSAAAAAESRRTDSINLAINADCSQQCGFCSIKETAAPQDDSAGLYARLEADLASSRQRGARTVRLNGYDPLAYPRILEIARLATILGYERAEVFSPSTRLADPGFCRALCEALPAEKHFFVPVYSANAATHDRVVGVPGSHARVLRALENIRVNVGPSNITVLFVATKLNLADVPDLVEFARSRGYHYSGHLPYPSFESRTDRFYQIAARQTDVVEGEAAVYSGTLHGAREGGPIPVLGVAPCVNLRVLAKHRVRLKAWLRVSNQKFMPGTEYRDANIRHGAEQRSHSAFAAATVRCPHAESCLLLEACGGELLRAYVDLYGIDEFRAVHLTELIDAS